MFMFIFAIFILWVDWVILFMEYFIWILGYLGYSEMDTPLKEKSIPLPTISPKIKDKNLVVALRGQVKR